MKLNRLQFLSAPKKAGFVIFALSSFPSLWLFNVKRALVLEWLCKQEQLRADMSNCEIAEFSRSANALAEDANSIARQAKHGEGLDEARTNKTTTRLTSATTIAAIALAVIALIGMLLN